MKPGSRLEVREDSAEGGAFAQRGFYDTQLKANCRFRRTGDSAPEYHCLPGLPYVAFVYRDATCNDRLALAYSSPTRPIVEGDFTFATERTWSGCHSSVLFRVGATVAPAQLYERSSSGACIVFTPNPGSEFREVADAAPAGYVAGTARTVQFSGGLEAVYVDGEDGSSTMQELREGGRHCSREGTGTQFVCGSDLAHSDGTLDADPTCNGTPVASRWTGQNRCGAAAPAEPAHIVKYRRDKNGCSEFEGIFGVGAKLEKAYSTDGSCSEEARPDTSYYALGPASPPETLPRVNLVLVGTSRLRSKYYAAPDGTLLDSQFAWRDQVLGVDCAAQPIAGGGWRCLPDVPVGQERFLDAACSEPVYGLFAHPCDPPPAPAALVRARLDSEGAVNAVFALDVHTGKQYERDGSGDCAEVQPVEGYSYYRLGAERPLDTFGEMQRVH